jgi:hypothetical protein
VIDVPEGLSRVPAKRALFGTDPYFRDCWDDLVDRYGQCGETLLHRVAPLVLRPDAMAARGGGRVVDAVRTLGLVPIAVARFRFDRHTTRETWRYQLNIATRERIDVMDMIMPVGESVYVLLRETSPTEVPATTRLSAAKGPSLPASRKPGQLRWIAGPAQASVLTYVHVADEPADIVREMAVFFDRPERMRLLDRLDSDEDAGAELAREVRRAEEGTAPSDFSWTRALARLQSALGVRPDCAGRRELEGLLDAIRRGRSRNWRGLLAAADSTALPWSHWDRVAVAAELSARHLPLPPVIPDVDLSEWIGSSSPDGASVGRRE